MSMPPSPPVLVRMAICGPFIGHCKTANMREKKKGHSIPPGLPLGYFASHNPFLSLILICKPLTRL